MDRECFFRDPKKKSGPGPAGQATGLLDLQTGPLLPREAVAMTITGSFKVSVIGQQKKSQKMGDFTSVGMIGSTNRVQP